MNSMRVLLFLSCCLLGGFQGFAEKENGGDWYDGREAWKSLEDFENEAVEVLEVGGRLVSGRLADVTETFVLVERKDSHDRMDRDQVHRITHIRPSTRKRNALRGAAIGVGGFGVLYYWMAHGKKGVDFAGMVAIGAVHAGLGSVIGLMTSSTESRAIIYEPSPIPPSLKLPIPADRRGTPCGCPAGSHRSPAESPRHPYESFDNGNAVGAADGRSPPSFSRDHAGGPAVGDF